MIFLELLWAAIPRRYLVISGAAIAALVIGTTTYKVHISRIRNAAFNKGYAVAYDSAAEATIQRLKVQHAADEARADSTYSVALQSQHSLDSALINDHGPSLNKRVVSMTPVSVIPPVSPDSDLEQSIPLSRLVRIVTAEPDTGYVTPNMAKLIAVYDTVVNYCCHRTVTVDSAVALALQWKKYGTSEHLVRLGSDSLAAAYAERLRQVELVPPHSTGWSRTLWGVALGIAVGAIAHNQLHR